ncbi:MAG: class I SAM-dependent methyltransferase [Planctomycetota bacterium]
MTSVLITPPGQSTATDGGDGLDSLRSLPAVPPVQAAATSARKSARDACPGCGSDEGALVAQGVRDHEYDAPGTYDWIGCGECGLIRLFPQPSDAVLNAAYPPGYQAYRDHGSKLVGWYVARRRLRRAAELARLVSDNGAVLDVGCGTGKLLSAMRPLGRFRLCGVEYRDEAAVNARRSGLSVWTGELEDAPLTPRSFDLVIMEHVIEHVRDPRATLTRIAGLLKSGGVLVGETPNLASWERRAFGKYWGGGHCPRHLTLFAPGALERLLRACGFAEVRIAHPIYSAHLALSLQNWFRRRETTAAGLQGGRAWYYPLLCSAAMLPALVAARRHNSSVIRFEARLSRD